MRILGAFTFLFLAAFLCDGSPPADAQGAILQSGPIVPFHPPAWFSNGVQGDGGYAYAPALNALGLFNGTSCPLGISSQTSPGVSTSPYGLFSICQTNAATTFVIQGLNGIATPTLNLNIGGTVYPFPGPGNGNVLGPSSAINGDAACFNTTSGKLIEDCGAPNPWLISGSNIYYTAGQVSIGTNTPTAGASLTTDGQVSIERNSATTDLVSVNGTLIGPNLFSHSFEDNTSFSGSGISAFASYDTLVSLTGPYAYNHLDQYEARGDYAGTGSLNLMVGFDSAPTVSGTGGVVNGLYHFFIDDAIVTSGSITTQIGLSIPDLNAATNNTGIQLAISSGANKYSINSMGTAQSLFTGLVTFNGGTVSTTGYFSAALTYGGVTLANSVTGTGSMVLSNNPVFGGTTVTLAPGTYASCTALTTNGSGVIGCTTSDPRLKNIDKDSYPFGLSQITQIVNNHGLITFRGKPGNIENVDTRHQAGFNCAVIQKYLPMGSHIDNRGYCNLDPMATQAALFNAVVQEQSEISKLRQEVVFLQLKAAKK